MPWWGDRGPAPHLEWPGVTIEIPAVWVPLEDARQIRQRDDGRMVWQRADGTIIADWWGNAGGRWESPDARYYFDVEAADRACDFFPTFLRHHIGEFAGQPFELMPYQKKLLTRPLFGWKRAEDDLRRLRKLFGFIAKGGGKSPWASGTALYLMLCDDEPGAEVYALANDKNQGRVVHTNAKVMVEESPELLEQCEVFRDSIVCDRTRSFLQVVSADATTKHGFRPHGAVFDEFHGQPNRDLFEAIKKSMVKRRQPMLIMITHAGDDDEGICYEEYEYAKKVISGTNADETHLPVIFEANPKDDWTSPAVWRRVNPGHGITVKTDSIAAECAEAQAEPRKLNDFLRYHLNRWVNSAVAWIPVDWWDACESEAIDIDQYLEWLAALQPTLATLPCAAGLDLAQKWDLACFALVFRHRLADPALAQSVEVVAEDAGAVVKKTVQLNYRITIVPHFWIPEETMREHEKKDGVSYARWCDAGLVTKTDGAIIDYSRIFNDITQVIVPKYPLLKQGFIGYDPAFATDIASQLRDKGHLKVEEVLQNYAHMTEVCHVFEALTKAKRISHGGHRVLRNHVEHAAVKKDDAGRIRPVKPRKSGKHIDGVVASLMGTKLLTKVPDARPITAFVV